MQIHINTIINVGQLPSQYQFRMHKKRVLDRIKLVRMKAMEIRKLEGESIPPADIAPEVQELFKVLMSVTALEKELAKYSFDIYPELAVTFLLCTECVIQSIELMHHKVLDI